MRGNMKYILNEPSEKVGKKEIEQCLEIRDEATEYISERY